MTNINTRLAEFDDLSKLAEIWHDKIKVQQQFDRRFRLLDSARQDWINYASECMAKESASIWVVELDTNLIGYLIVHVQTFRPGLFPIRIGHITEMAFDVHNPHPGLGNHLLLAVRDWLVMQEIEDIVVQVPKRLMVDQAFWKAKGATEWMDLMWLSL